MIRARRVWKEADVRSLGVRTDIETACAIVLGVGRTRAYELLHAGELPFPVLRVGRKVAVPTAPLLKLLGYETQQPSD